MGQVIPASTSGRRDNTTVSSKCRVEKERIPDGLPSLSPPKGPAGPAGRGGQGEAGWVRRASGSHLLLPGEGEKQDPVCYEACIPRGCPQRKSGSHKEGKIDGGEEVDPNSNCPL